MIDDDTKPIKLDTARTSDDELKHLDLSVKLSDQKDNLSDKSFILGNSGEKAVEDCGDFVCEVFKSTKGGLKLYIDGYTYIKNKSKDDIIYWFCDSRYGSKHPCKATVVTVINEEGQHILDKKQKKHNHKPDPLKKKIAEFKDKVKEIAGDASEDIKLNDILQNARSAVSDLPKNLPSTTALRQMIYRQKCKKVVKIPEPTDIFFDLNEAETQINGVNFVIKDRVYDENKRLVIMSTLDLMFMLGNAEYWILHSIQLSTQLFTYLHTLHGNLTCEKNKTLPLLFCLSTQKDQRCFDEMFGLIMEYGSENKLSICPKICVVDFDPDVMLSLHSNFQDILLQGCNFHLRQIIFRKIQDLNFERKLATDVNFNLEIKCIAALSNLSEEYIPTYFEKLKENLQDADSGLMAKWFGEEYIYGREGVLTFPTAFWCHKPHMDIPRTQDYAEAWHHQIKIFVSKQHPGFYALTKELIKETLVQMCDIQKTMCQPPPSPPTQKRPRRRKKKKASGIDSRIDTILERKNELSEIDVLKSIAKLLRL